MNDGDSEYLGLEVGRDGIIIENRTLSNRQSSSSPIVGQVSEKSIILPKILLHRTNWNALFYAHGNRLERKIRDFDDFELQKMNSITTAQQSMVFLTN